MPANTNTEYGRKIYFAAMTELNDAKRRGDTETARYALDELEGLWVHRINFDAGLVGLVSKTLITHGREDQMKAYDC